MGTRGVTISYFHHMIVLAKQIHDNNIVMILSIYRKKKPTVKLNVFFNFVYSVFCFFFGK